MFFGCIGPTFTNVTAVPVSATASSVTLDSRVAPQWPSPLPNGATVQSTE